MKLLRLILASALLSVTAADAAENWPRFRGENGTGLSHQKGIPVTWTDSDFAWKVEFPNIGHSAPVVWDKHLFVTTATEGGSNRFLHCLNADTGAEQWQVTMTFHDSPKHTKNSWASSTPATDGERVYVIFADEESQVIGAWDFAGKQVWTRNIGAFGKDHGQGVSPIVANGLVIVPNDQPGPSSVLALNSQTGEVVWTVDRPTEKTSFSTPMLLPGKDGSTQLICLSQAAGMTSYDLLTGRLNWKTPAMPLRTVASPVEHQGLIVAYCGQAGNGKYLMAVHADEDVREESRIAFERKVQLPYVPTCIATDGLLFLWGDAGVVTCLEMQTGRELWTKRISNAAFSGSPVWIDGKLYAMSENGDVYVLSAAREYELLGTTPLGEASHSTPAVANGHLYLRTFTKLIALKARE